MAVAHTISERLVHNPHPGVSAAIGGGLCVLLVACSATPRARLSTAASRDTSSTVSLSTMTTDTVTVDNTVSPVTGQTASIGPESTIKATPSTTGPPPPATSPPTTTAPPPPPSSGAYGYVTAGPTCPVQRAGQSCPPQPVAARIAAQDSAARVVATTNSDSTGHYQLALAPGSYTLTATTGSTYPRCQPRAVTIPAVTSARADISCDTGIR